MAYETISNGWVLAQSKSHPGWEYYFNVNTGASYWKDGDQPCRNGPDSPPTEPVVGNVEAVSNDLAPEDTSSEEVLQNIASAEDGNENNNVDNECIPSLLEEIKDGSSNNDEEELKNPEYLVDESANDNTCRINEDVVSENLTGGISENETVATKVDVSQKCVSLESERLKDGSLQEKESKKRLSFEDSSETRRIQNILKKKEVGDKMARWILSQKTIWKKLQDCIQTEDDEDDIIEWEVIYEDIKYRRLFWRLLIKPNDSCHLTRSAFENEKTWQMLSSVLDWDNTDILAAMGPDLSKRIQTLDFMLSKDIDDDFALWILHSKTISHKLADKIEHSGRQDCSCCESWERTLFDLERDRVSTFLKKNLRETYFGHWKTWIMSNERVWMDLSNNIVYSKEKGDHILGWDTVVPDLKRRLVRKFMEDNMVEAGWQAFIMNNEKLMGSLAYSISRLIQPDEQLHPKKRHVLAAFRHCPRSKVKVVILGEDPRKHCATGLAFSYAEDQMESDQAGNSAMNKIHRALRQIYHSESSYPAPKEKVTSCCHVNWAKRGVLLLNTALTYTHKSDKTTHKNIWDDFIRALIVALLQEELPELVILCWSAAARKIYEYVERHKEQIKSQPCHRLFSGYHPAERGGLFISQAKEPLILIERKWPGLLRLEQDQEKKDMDDIDELTNKLGCLRT